MMRRWATGIGVAVVAGIVLTAGTAQASPTNNASSIALTCARGVRNRTSIPTGTVPAGYVTVSLWTTTSGGSCPGAGPLAFKGSCAAVGSSGAQLTVR